ncbi:MarR family winged helix-turn-helix transcriptional regulator [Bacillus kexueae]|uniref:MarR family winged helix-turn-helix transcriptional regulator n=1 Tax=Aeribacillus kexueae TaxID=2078952 RepID=UPI001FAEF65D|nr:MarR family transcriptional regulator [Bacillus kexueae]
MNAKQEHVVHIEKSLRNIAVIIQQKGREILSDYQITPPQFVALQNLLEFGDLTIGELSAKMYLACSTMTDLIDRMEKNDLVVRVRDERDRRVVRIHLLPEGERIIAEAIRKRQEYLHEILASFSHDEKNQLQTLLIKLHEEMLQ